MRKNTSGMAVTTTSKRTLGVTMGVEAFFCRSRYLKKK
jgi:hypothetical protein